MGGLGFAVDLGCTALLVWSGVSPFYARPPAIALATVVTWIANRSFTFQVMEKTSLAEGMRYAATALAAACVNYAIYSLLVWQKCPPLAAVAIAPVLQTGRVLSVTVNLRSDLIHENEHDRLPSLQDRHGQDHTTIRANPAILLRQESRFRYGQECS